MTVSRLQHATRFHVPRLPGADYRNRVNERLFVTLSSYYQTKNQGGDHRRVGIAGLALFIDLFLN